VQVFDHAGRYLQSLGAGVRARHALAARGSRVLVGSYDAVHLFAARSGRTIRVFEDPDPAAQLFFGAAVALLGRTVVVGAPGTGSPLVPGPAGRVYGFDRRTGALLWTRAHPDDPAGETHAGRYFGWQVAPVGRDVLVGPDAFRLHARTGANVQVYADPDGGPSGPSWFGGAVAASGNRVAIGDAAFGPRGAVHVYEAASGALVETIEPEDSFASDGAGRFVALHRRYVATTSSSYNGSPRLLGFRR
jgi:outer membrane protein assembly factor BamB